MSEVWAVRRGWWHVDVMLRSVVSVKDRRHQLRPGRQEASK